MLQVIYERIPSGVFALDSALLDDPAVDFEGGRLFHLSAEGFVTLADGTKPVFGVGADSKADVLASGKVTVYFSGGLYLTDAFDSAGTYALNDRLKAGAVGGAKGFFLRWDPAVDSPADVVGVVTKVPTTSDPFLGVKLLV